MNILRFLCQIGLHKWQWDTTIEYAGDGEHYIRDHARCSRLGCPTYPMWRTVNVERRRLSW
jgi:hypothetical protein